MQAWNTLREFYNRTTLHNRVMMTRRLHEVKMENGSAISKRLDAFDELVVGLQTLEEPRDCPEQNGASGNDEVFSMSEVQTVGWLIDSGAMAHMTPHRADLFEYEALDTGFEVAIAVGKKSRVAGRGTQEEARFVQYARIDSEWELWQARMGHCNENALAKMELAMVGFAKKRDENGRVIQYKARLVAKEFKQKFGVNVFETYSPVANMNSIPVMMAVCVVNGYIMEQLDVDTAFLDSQLKDHVYMEVPPIGVENDDNRVCQLNKLWADQFDYVKCSRNGYGYVYLYVDDMILTSKTKDEIREVKNTLKAAFKM
ncbi:Gag-pol Polyprotein [Phytophthora megakarya]|uniref:Gag-pol Polyprotein n=1 Tax=Phytophthora megakarya TaxID=4795 RepID=A0A225W741_9STRA|nr:Gag-pol Polyprotein [Phytophthora megakarya]